jgi:hypothetical protein
VDLEFKRKGLYHIVSIKSGTSWGNSDQVNKMRDNFKVARAALRERGIRKEVVAVNGCIYGKDRVPFKTHADPDKQYFKYAGRIFGTSFRKTTSLSYREIIVPIDGKLGKKMKRSRKPTPPK